MADFQYEIVEELGVLSESAKGWTKKLLGVRYKETRGNFDDNRRIYVILLESIHFD